MKINFTPENGDIVIDHNKDYGLVLGVDNNIVEVAVDDLDRPDHFLIPIEKMGIKITSEIAPNAEIHALTVSDIDAISCVSFDFFIKENFKDFPQMNLSYGW